MERRCVGCVVSQAIIHTNNNYSLQKKLPQQTSERRLCMQMCGPASVAISWRQFLGSDS
jgi:hypothetical protein